MVAPALQALNDFINVLSEIPASVIQGGHINSSEPRTTNDLPHITVTSSGINEAQIGIGGILLLQKTGEEQFRETTGYKVTTTFRLDIWADSASEVEGITQAVTQFLFDKRGDMRGQGFVRLSLDSIGEIVQTSVRRLVGNANAYRRSLEYRARYEQIISEAPEPGGIIKKINVEIDEQFKESMEIS